MIALVYDPRVNRIEAAIIKDTRFNVKSGFDDYIYETLYDVEFVYDGHYSKGHLPHAVEF